MRDGRRISNRKLTWTELMEMTLHTPVIANGRERERWTTETGSRWLERHAIIDQQIAPLGRRTMDRANIQLGWRVLDVGCGCGETAVELAWRVGHSGSVRGVDISAPLIEAARALAQKSDLRNVRFDEADAQTFLFSAASFDLIFSRFGIMFFDDPDAAFHNLRSALRPGGRLAFACWPAPRENQFVTIPVAAAARHVPLPAPADPDAPGPFAFAEAERVRRILSRSDFSDIAIEPVTQKVGGMVLEETTHLLFQLRPLDVISAGVHGGAKHAITTDLLASLRPVVNSRPGSLDVPWL